MKRYFRHIILTLASLQLLSCSDFLEVDTLGKVTIPNLFSDVDGMRSAVAGMYSKTFDYYSSEFYEYPEVAGNMVDIRSVTSSPSMLFQYNFTSAPDQEVGAVGYVWRKILVALANTNNIIQYQPGLLKEYPAYANELNRIKAEALFIRALSHFDLCRAYAQPYFYTPDASHLGVPVLKITPSPVEEISRGTVKQVYDLVKADLLEAEQLFGTTAMQDAYHASGKSVQALLSRVYLYTREWDKVVQYSTSVINSSELAQGNDYLAMFNGLIAGKEAIFRLNGRLKAKTLAQFYSVEDPVAIAADTLLKLFDDNTDIRLRLFDELPKEKNKYSTAKFKIKIDYELIEERYDPIVLRVSEMYLNRAEAYLNMNEPDKAIADLKVIMARALGKTVGEITINTTDKAAIAALIEKERAKELCFEGHNFFDITRQGKNLVRGAGTNSDVKFMAYPSDYFVLPIPQTELDANPKMVGNPTVNK
ncbi:MAG: RagB/SusD family nutrient uptake outer membrane protein [Bacteroidetes bacterium]|nr:RagB/SusD family nutrient uptake outer membrane protein [Bacteroidota bacterium]